MKISESVKAAVSTDPESQRWANLAGALGQAIVQRALAMPHDELRAFIADTEAGKRIAGACADDKAIASASCIVQMALL